jgi:hypothetical protein
MDRTQIVDLIPKYSFGHNCASNLEFENTSFFTSTFQNIFNNLNKAQFEQVLVKGCLK